MMRACGSAPSMRGIYRVQSGRSLIGIRGVYRFVEWLACGNPSARRPARSGAIRPGPTALKRDVLSKADSGWLRLPRAPWCTRSWLRSLTAEHEQVIERAGRRVSVWRQHYARNEVLDCLVYALAVAELVPRPRRRRARLVPV